MIDGGISYHGLSKLIILDGTLNEFLYGQVLLFYKDDINSLNLMHNSTFILEKMEYKRIDINQTNTCSINFFLNVIGFKILLILLIWHILEKIYGE